MALYTQKILGYDAWTSGLVARPGRGGHHDRADDLRAPGLAHGPAPDARWRLRRLRRVRALADDPGDVDDGLLEPRAGRGSSRASRMGSSSCRCRRSRSPPSRRSAWATRRPPTTCVRNIGGSVGRGHRDRRCSRAAASTTRRRWSGHVTSRTPRRPSGCATWTAHFVARGPTPSPPSRRAMAMVYREAARRRRRCSPMPTTSGCSSCSVARGLPHSVHAPRARRAGRSPARQQAARDPGLPAAAD